MALYALENLDDAIDVTRRLLQPVNRSQWLKLALVVIFVGGPGFNLFSSSFGGSTGNGGVGPPTVEFGPRIWVLVAAVIVLLLLIGLVIGLVASIMEFVFVESLRTQTVKIRHYWSQRWPQGLRLFGFRLLLGLLSLAAVAVLLAPFALTLLGVGTFDPGIAIAIGIGAVPVVLVLLMSVAVFYAFTTNFVVPIMVLEGTGVLAGWRRLWPSIKAAWVQYLAYALVATFLSLIGGVVVGIGTVIGAVVLLIPFGVLFAVAGLFFVFVAEPVGLVALVGVGLVYVLAVLVVGALVQVPVKSYLRYYALLVLGDVDDDLDLIPEQRAAVRDADSERP
jgi:hypothetical protein